MVNFGRIAHRLTLRQDRGHGQRITADLCDVLIVAAAPVLEELWRRHERLLQVSDEAVKNAHTRFEKKENRR